MSDKKDHKQKNYWKRCHELGFETYEDYLASPHWADFGDRYRRAHGDPGCLVCQKRPVQLHHVSYQRLGQERLEDVVPLCRFHHEEVHQLLRQRRWTVTLTHRVVGILKGRLLQKQQDMTLGQAPADLVTQIAQLRSLVTRLGITLGKKVLDAIARGNQILIEETLVRLRRARVRQKQRRDQQRQRTTKKSRPEQKRTDRPEKKRTKKNRKKASVRPRRHPVPPELLQQGEQARQRADQSLTDYHTRALEDPLVLIRVGLVPPPRAQAGG